MKQSEISERNKKIVEMAKEGKTADFIAKSFCMSKIRIQGILKSFKVKPGKISHALECDMARKIIHELDAGTKQIEIGRKFNISRQYVNQVKKQYESRKG